MKVENAVKEYLKQKGPVEEATSMSSGLLTANTPMLAYETNYRLLCNWIQSSLDMYKVELQTVLYPIFVHVYLDLFEKDAIDAAKGFLNNCGQDFVENHSADLTTLVSLLPSNFKDNSLVHTFRSNKFSIAMQSTPFELLLTFLQDNTLLNILKIVNQYLDLKVVSGHVKVSNELKVNVYGITGHSANQIEEFHSRALYLSPFPFDTEIDQELLKRLGQEDERLAEEDVKLVEIYSQMRKDIDADAVPNEVVPVPSVKEVDVRSKIEEMKDAAKRVALGPSSPPSICCYTFYHTHNSLTCSDISEDLTFIAAGFSDSTIKVWSLRQGEKVKALRRNVIPAEITESTEEKYLKEEEGSVFKRLVGHSGPVFSVKISGNNRFLISCSQDATNTFTNLVAYSGHVYPVWDIDISPSGMYFVSGSHDRTARIWSSDHIHPLRILVGHLSDVESVKFHPNENFVATGSSDGTARLWDIQSGSCVRVFVHSSLSKSISKQVEDSRVFSGAINCLAFSYDGKMLATAGDDPFIYLWDISSGKPLARFAMAKTTSPMMPFSIAFSRDDKVLIVGGSAYAIVVYDVQSALENGGSFDGESADGCILGAYATKKTKLVKVFVSRRNLIVAAGGYEDKA